jgi:hypothetical protein
MLLVTTVFLGQEEKKLTTKYGVDITYQLVLEDESKRKDSYILIVHATNNSEADLYYPIKIETDETVVALNSLMSGSDGFTKITVRNSTGWFGDGKSISGDKTKLNTTDNNVLFELKKGGVYTYETSFKVKSGKKPIITNSFSTILQTLENFDLQISDEMLNGEYVSSCGDINLSITSLNDLEKGDHLIQTVNGNQFIWIKKTDTTYKRENNDQITLSYNKSESKFIYSTSDGISCTWDKK